MNLIINTRSVLEVIDLDSVVFLQAEGNYTYFYLNGGKMRVQLSNLTVFADQITKLYSDAGSPSPFYRLGRSYLVNINYVFSINLQSCQIVFSDTLTKPVVSTKGVLRAMKNHMVSIFCPGQLPIDPDD